MDWRRKLNPDATENNHYVTSTAWIRRMEDAIAYIEEHLDTEIDFVEAAKKAGCSVYHFQRFFTFVAEIPLSEYIRRRRLTMAAFELQDSDVKIIDLALKYGYESPEAFSRAFRNMHGISPTLAREKQASLKAFSSITFHMSIKGEKEMNYFIEQREPFTLFGVTKHVSTLHNENFVSIPKFWDACRADGTIERIRSVAGLAPGTPVHAAMFNCTDDSHTYMIGYYTPSDEIPDGYTILSVPASTWAVFPIEESTMAASAEKASLMWKRIFTEWFATSGYELSGAPELELHERRDGGKFVTEIRIPVKK